MKDFFRNSFRRLKLFLGRVLGRLRPYRRIYFVYIPVAVIIAAFLLIEIFPGYLTGKRSGTLDIQQNMTIRDTAYQLAKNGYIIDPYGFILLVKLSGGDTTIKSGEHTLKDISTVFGIVVEIKRSVIGEQVVVTIPEGFSIKDIDERLYQKGLIPKMGDFYNYAKGYEGFLFPDTYFFYNGISMQDIVKMMNDRFKQVVPQNFSDLAQAKGFTEEQVVTLASIVEKEVRFDQDRPLAASVFINRLKIGMPLDADSTIVYLLPEAKQWLDPEDYKIESPYNTYLHAGLPPGPICNPSIKSIVAVLDAPQTDYYYFITKPDGEAIFEKTLEEHNRDLAKYYGSN
jgi:UPF0755 protein